MSSTKARHKERKHSERLLADAWQALEKRELALAEKLGLRATENGAMNPRIWHEHGLLLLALDKLDDAEKSLMMAVRIAPSFQEARDELMSLRARLGRLRAEHEASASVPIDEPFAFTELTTRYDWDAIESQLRARGHARLDALLDAAAWRERAGDDDCFEHPRRVDDEHGRAIYRYFAWPLPEDLVRVRAELYARGAVMANLWQQELSRTPLFPRRHEPFRELCLAAGQIATSPMRIECERDGLFGLHRDLAGKVVFPLQLLIALGPDGEGGEFVLVDDRPGRKKHRSAVALRAGDAVLFCTKERFVTLAGVIGLQPVSWGIATVRRERGLWLSVPFHELR